MANSPKINMVVSLKANKYFKKLRKRAPVAVKDGVVSSPSQVEVSNISSLCSVLSDKRGSVPSHHQRDRDEEDCKTDETLDIEIETRNHENLESLLTASTGDFDHVAADEEDHEWLWREKPSCFKQVLLPGATLESISELSESCFDIQPTFDHVPQERDSVLLPLPQPPLSPSHSERRWCSDSNQNSARFSSLHGFAPKAQEHSSSLPSIPQMVMCSPPPAENKCPAFSKVASSTSIDCPVLPPKRVSSEVDIVGCDDLLLSPASSVRLDAGHQRLIDEAVDRKLRSEMRALQEFKECIREEVSSMRSQLDSQVQAFEVASKTLESIVQITTEMKEIVPLMNKKLEKVEKNSEKRFDESMEVVRQLTMATHQNMQSELSKMKEMNCAHNNNIIVE